MKHTVHFYGTVDKGKIHFDNPNLMADFIKTIPDGAKLVITLQKQYMSKTRNQLGYYFSIIKLASDELGYSMDPTGHFELDSLFRSMFLVQQAGTINEHIKELSDLNVREMGDYIDNVIRELGTLGMVVPPPESQD